MKTHLLINKIISTILICFSISVSAQSQKIPDESQLQVGQCYSLPESKMYLENLQSKPGSYSKMISEIGSEKVAGLKNTESTNFYFCQVRCKNKNGLMDTLWTTLSDSTSRFSDMNGFLCAGVSIENVQIVGSIYGPQPVINTYWAFESLPSEPYEWIRSINFKLSASEFKNKMAVLRTNLNYIAASYITSTSPVLMSSAQALSFFANGTSEGEAALVKYVSGLAAENWSPQNVAMGSAEYFTITALKSQARFVEFAPVVK